MAGRDREFLTRLHTLDALRGIAALTVVAWHWQHFFYDGTRLSRDFQHAAQPFYGALLLFYHHGWLAVDLFFSLSGFIFFWLYRDKIYRNQVGLREFFILRFSRLYPLHILTFLVVAIGQIAFIGRNGTPFVYPYNDLWHAALNVTMLSSVGLEQGYSFNAPIWSVSVEIALYMFFFFLARTGLARPGIALALSIVGFLLLKSIYVPLGRGVGSFFAGALTYFAYERIMRSEKLSSATGCLVVATLAGWLGTVAAVYIGWSYKELPFLWRLPSPAVCVLFPLTILTLALTEASGFVGARRFSLLGDISYSSYLLHFPAQLATVLLIQSTGMDRGLLLAPEALMAFIAGVVLASAMAFRYFEMPAQRYLRRRLLGPRSP